MVIRKDWGPLKGSSPPISRLGAPCAVCGSYDNVEMHHIRAIKDIEISKTIIQKHVIQIQRKQIPLC